MNDRERLIELLSENFVEFCHVGLIAGNCKISAVTFDADKFADYLIANGVMVQKQGKWVEYGRRCSECGECEPCDISGSYLQSRYCHNCGAKMENGHGNEED